MWSFGFVIPATTANDLRLRRIFYPRSYPLHYFILLILEKEPVFPFSMLSAKQGNYWYHFCNVFGISRTQCQHYTTRLSRRRFLNVCNCNPTLIRVCGYQTYFRDPNVYYCMLRIIVNIISRLRFYLLKSSLLRAFSNITHLTHACFFQYMHREA